MKIKIHNDLWKVKLTDGRKKKMTQDKDHYSLGLTEYSKLLIHIRTGLMGMKSLPLPIRSWKE